MSALPAGPRRIRRIAARREFHSTTGTPVVLTFGVPEKVPGSDWGCAVQITGVRSPFRRPQYVHGVDGLQALQLAMMTAAAALAKKQAELSWLGERGDLGLRTFLSR